MKRWSKPKISFSSFRLAAGGLGGAAQKNERKFLGLPRATSGSASEARREHHHALRAYDFIQSHHARGACEDQSLRDWKKVRAKVNISPPMKNHSDAIERSGGIFIRMRRDSKDGGGIQDEEVRRVLVAESGQEPLSILESAGRKEYLVSQRRIPPSPHKIESSAR